MPSLLPPRLLAGLALSSLILLLVAGASVAQTTRYVSLTGSTAPASATSWASSTTSLQGAIDFVAANGGGQVWVAAGVYKPTTGTDRTINFSMKNGVAIYGSFVGTETTLTGPTGRTLSFPGSTTLSGNIGGAGNTDNSYHLIFNPAGLTTTAELDGFVITGGYANGSFPNNEGAAMYNYGRSSICSPTIRNCLFTENYASTGGGAIYNDGYTGNSSPILTNCSFQSNSANQGGAMTNDGFSGMSSPVLTNCSFRNNLSTGNGGAIFNEGSGNGINRPVLTNCSFQSNSANAGGALFNSGSTSNPQLINCVVFGNGGSSTFLNFSSSITANYSLFDKTVTGYVTAPTNLTTTTSPFVSASSVALNACSPAINAGNSASYTAATSLTVDLAGNPRIVGISIDMGAVEFQTTPNYPVALTLSPASGSAVCAGSSVSVPVGVTGTLTGYQWYKDGTAVVSQTAATLSLPAVTTANAGSYSVVVTGFCNSVTSTAFSLTVNAVPTLAISSVTVCQGQLVSLTATGCGGGSVVWSTGAVGSSLTLTAGASSSVLTATCTAGICSTTTSGNIVVAGSLPPPAQILSRMADESSCPVRLQGQGVGNSFVFTGPAGYVFSNVFRLGGTHTIIGLDVKQPGVYTLTATNTNECGSSVPVSQTVTVNRSCP